VIDPGVADIGVARSMDGGETIGAATADELMFAADEGN
jgi:hypothetical protein